MAKNKKVHIKSLIFLGLFLFTFVMCIVVGVVSFFELGNEFKIDSPSDFIHAINHSNETGKKYKYVVTGPFDINIDENELPIGKSFYGDLNGNGYTITLKSNNDKILKSPIFSSIQECASIKNLSFKMELTLGEDDNESDIALLANRNFGSVKDCSFVINNIYIGNRCKKASAIVNDNFGTIESICISVNAVNSSQTRTDWQCDFGTVATVNYATVKNVFVSVALDDFGIFDKFYDNQKVGYVFSEIGCAVKTNDVGQIYLFGNCSFWDFSVDALRMSNNNIVYGTVYGAKPTSELISEFVNFSGEKNIWLISESQLDKSTGFPILKNSIER